MREKATNIITRAIHARSKPGLALAVLEAANKPGSPGVPRQLRTVIERVAGLARAEEPDRQPGPSTRAFRALAQGTPSKVEG
jgi:hypothetical protein